MLRGFTTLCINFSLIFFIFKSFNGASSEVKLSWVESMLELDNEIHQVRCKVRISDERNENFIVSKLDSL